MESITDLRPYKKELRTDCRRKRAEIDPAKKAHFDKRIQNRLLNLWAVREADTVLAYVSTPIEVETTFLLQALFDLGKQVAVPRCENDQGDMKFFLIRSFADLEKGHFGLSEPKKEICTELITFENTVCVVPAFHFDESGFRLGWGKGYYDRFLSSYTGETIGVCYDDELVKELPHGKYDRTVDLIVTEKRILTRLVEGSL